MIITNETVRHVATLARLEISSEETTAYSEQLSRILGLMEQLQSIPTQGIAPMSHPLEMTLPERDDRVTNANQQELMLANAPDSEAGCFRVPKIIE